MIRMYINYITDGLDGWNKMQSQGKVGGQHNNSHYNKLLSKASATDLCIRCIGKHRNRCNFAYALFHDQYTFEYVVHSYAHAVRR